MILSYWKRSVFTTIAHVIEKSMCSMMWASNVKYKQILTVNVGRSCHQVPLLSRQVCSQYVLESPGILRQFCFKNWFDGWTGSLKWFNEQKVTGTIILIIFWFDWLVNDMPANCRNLVTERPNKMRTLKTEFLDPVNLGEPSHMPKNIHTKTLCGWIGSGLSRLPWKSHLGTYMFGKLLIFGINIISVNKQLDN